MHSHLGLEWGATAAERASWASEGLSDQGDHCPERPRYFNPKQANIIICDEDPTVSLVEELRLSPEDIRAVEGDGLGEKILAGLVHPAGLLSYLRDHRISADQLRESRGRRAHEGAVPRTNLEPGGGRRRGGAGGAFRTTPRSAFACIRAPG